eukprot:1184526-Prorocentrum_minimum.AAC.2
MGRDGTPRITQLTRPVPCPIPGGAEGWPGGEMRAARGARRGGLAVEMRAAQGARRGGLAVKCELLRGCGGVAWR